MAIDDFKQLKKELKSITKHLTALDKIRLDKAESLSEIEKGLKNLKSGEAIGRAIDEWRKKAAEALRKAKKEKKDGFGKIMSSFIRSEEEKKTLTKELDKSWRIGPLEVQLRKELSQVQIAYNNEIIIKWSPVAKTEDISGLYELGLKRLEENAIPIGALAEIFWEAYDYLSWQQSKSKNARSDRVPLKRFYDESRLALMRYAMRQKARLPKDLPRWAFLYNLDIYRSKAPEIPKDRRLGLETGNQADTPKMGLVTNGLKPEHDYKTYCYVFAAEGRK